MMKTPKDKAGELVEELMSAQCSNPEDSMEDWKEGAKRCALIVVAKILQAMSVPPIENKGHALFDSQIDYWTEVKSEIEKL